MCVSNRPPCSRQCVYGSQTRFCYRPAMLRFEWRRVTFLLLGPPYVSNITHICIFVNVIQITLYLYLLYVADKQRKSFFIISKKSVDLRFLGLEYVESSKINYFKIHGFLLIISHVLIFQIDTT